MKPYAIAAIITAILLLGICSFAHAEYLLSTGIRYDRFVDDRSPETSGFEVTVPLGVAYIHEHFSISVESAFSSATADPDAEGDVTLSSLTDTLVSFTYRRSFSEYSLGLIAGVDLNLPTGKEQLSDREVLAQAGEKNDLFEVDNFGDGFNVGLSFGVVKEFGDVGFALQGAYIMNGKFDPTSDLPEDDLDPGDQFLGLALVDWEISSQFELDTFIAYSHFSPDKRNGQKDFQGGDSVIWGGNLQYDRESVGILVSLQGMLRGKSKELVEGKLERESDNSNGNDFFGLVHVTYQMTPKLILRMLGDLRYYSESPAKDAEGNLPAEGQRVRYALGPGVVYNLTDHLSCDALAKYFIMDQKPEMGMPQEVRYQGMNLSLGFTYTF